MFQPLRDRVLIKQEDADEKIGSIVVPAQAMERPLKGTVIAVGSGRVLETGERLEPEVCKGQVVLFRRTSSEAEGDTEIEIDGVTHLVIRERDILGIVRGLEN